MFTAPVSRSVRVADIQRSAHFYEKILDFSRTGDGSLVFGPVQVSLVPAQSPARQIVFFETDDVVVLHERVVSRGGSPGEIERVNWIKMDMFELRDPDGHFLWFGHSFHRSTRDMHMPPGEGDLRQINPVMPYSDVSRGVAYYRDVLGFCINYAHDDFAVLDRDAVRILLSSKRARDGAGSCYIYVADADALYASLTSKGARVQGPPVSHPWGLRDFTVVDPEGNELSFGQPFE